MQYAIRFGDFIELKACILTASRAAGATYVAEGVAAQHINRPMLHTRIKPWQCRRLHDAPVAPMGTTKQSDDAKAGCRTKHLQACTTCCGHTVTALLHASRILGHLVAVETASQHAAT
jgi:hypothetical protein